jgi:hypothetical protein
MMRYESRIITDKVSRKGRGKDRRGIIKGGRRTAAGDFGGCGRL